MKQRGAVRLHLAGGPDTDAHASGHLVHLSEAHGTVGEFLAHVAQLHLHDGGQLVHLDAGAHHVGGGGLDAVGTLELAGQPLPEVIGQPGACPGHHQPGHASGGTLERTEGDHPEELTVAPGQGQAISRPLGRLGGDQRHPLLGGQDLVEIRAQAQKRPAGGPGGIHGGAELSRPRTQLLLELV